MTDQNGISAAHIRYLLVIRRLHRETGVSGAQIAAELRVSRPTVHKMMDVFLEREYIAKEPQGRVYLTDHGIRVADAYDAYCSRLTDILFSGRSTDPSAESGICSLLAELSEENLAVLAEVIGISRS